VTSLAAAAHEAAQVLRAAGIASPEVDARWLVEAASGIDPRRAPEVALDAAVADALATMLAQRTARVPLQLVVGTTAFRTSTLVCRPGVFVPRPETEVLAGLAVDAARRALAARHQTEARTTPGTLHAASTPPLVLEPCCGTGAIGLAVASEVEGLDVRLGDASDAAVALAQHNRALLATQQQLRSAVTITRGDLLGAFDAGLVGSVDVLVANPPYLPRADLATLDPEVAEHDPALALFGGSDGHEVVGRLLREASGWLRPGGTILLEVDARRSDEVLEEARSCGLVDARTHADLTGAARFVVARRGPTDTRR
jgi:release factor glutamine methyltransferase